MGAVATQSHCNTSFGPRGFALLENGASPEQALEILTVAIPSGDYRQVGIIDDKGARPASPARAVSTGPVITMANTARPKAMPWLQRGGEGMVCGRSRRRAGRWPNACWRRYRPVRLPAATAGQQSAALWLNGAEWYGGFDDRYVEISVATIRPRSPNRTVVRHPIG